MAIDLELLDDEIAARADVAALDVSADRLPVLQDGAIVLISPANLAGAIDTSLIDDSISNGVTDRAPSQNAVYDALALKADLISPTLVTPVLGVATATSIDFAGQTAATLSASSSRLTMEGVNIVTISSSDTLTNKTLTSPILTTPVLGVATATSINGLTITSSTGTLTITNGKTLSVSNTLTFTGTDSSSVAFGTGGTVLYSGGALGTPASGTLTNCTNLPVAGITASTSTALGVGSLEVGHATDTTLSRASSGVLAVEGHNIATVDQAQAISAVYTFSAQPVINLSSASARSIQIKDNGSTVAYWGAQTSSSYVFIIQDATPSNVLLLTSAGVMTLAGYVVAHENNTITLSNKTIASPTLSGTVAGSPTASGSWTFSANTLTLSPGSSNSAFIINSVGTTSAYIGFQSGGTNKWAVGRGVLSGNNDFNFYNQATGGQVFNIDATSSVLNFGVRPTILSEDMVTTASNAIKSVVTLGNGAGASLGTLSNAPAAGNPTKWIPINDNGTTRYVPAW